MILKMLILLMMVIFMFLVNENFIKNILVLMMLLFSLSFFFVLNMINISLFNYMFIFSTLNGISLVFFIIISLENMKFKFFVSKSSFFFFFLVFFFFFSKNFMDLSFNLFSNSMIFFNMKKFCMIFLIVFLFNFLFSMKKYFKIKLMFIKISE